MRPLAEYRTWIFDCDGVILDSNEIKSRAFRHAILEYGDGPADAFMAYNRKNGGLSRFEKFDHFFSSIRKCESSPDRTTRALEKFSSCVVAELDRCAFDQGLLPLMQRIPVIARRFVVSGGDQAELRGVLARRGLSSLFSEIYGSPETKKAIIAREIAAGNIIEPAILIGDSLLDYETAMAFGMRFVFISHWTQFDAWREFFSGRDVMIASDLQMLVDHFEQKRDGIRGKLS